MVEKIEITDKSVDGYRLIVSQDELGALVNGWLQEPVVSIDTEFMRTNTYFSKPGLIQIADSQGVYIIDPLKVTNLHPLGELLCSDKVIKVMHAMSEDIELLYHATEVKAQSVFDTQTAAAFLGYGASLGYQKLVGDVLSIELDKSETRSDWLKRPLTDSQLSYAAKDAEYLLYLYEKLKSALLSKQLLAAVFDEVASVIDQTILTWEQPENAYLKLRGAWELSLDSQRLLKALVEWRDGLAIKENIPKPWIFNDSLLIKIAEDKPSSLGQLKRYKGMQFKSLRQFGEAVIEFIESYSPGSAGDDFVLVDHPVKGPELDLFKKLKRVVAEVAEHSGIAVQLLGSRKMLEHLVIHCYRKNKTQLPESYSGWRKGYLGEKIVAILEEAV